MEQLPKLTAEDSECGRIRSQIEEGTTRLFWLEDGLIYAQGRRPYVPKKGNLRKKLMSEVHDSLWAGHPGRERDVDLWQWEDLIQDYLQRHPVASSRTTNNLGGGEFSTEPGSLPPPQAPKDRLKSSQLCTLGLGYRKENSSNHNPMN